MLKKGLRVRREVPGMQEQLQMRVETWVHAWVRKWMKT